MVTCPVVTSFGTTTEPCVLAIEVVNMVARSAGPAEVLSMLTTIKDARGSAAAADQPLDMPLARYPWRAVDS